ncbi:replicative helicase loader/inhibitor [Bacillus sp. Marseille-P3661]|uniref:replicative helicase loader/inhibitor n=1 Tax=Bacillus sp. Marseille-P3661 TaxID=1936234 RepID=UPI0015E18F0D|nr:replicative helicase loader/inhibitor [Bacillus sp. Marseille-P3661]
MNKDQCYDIIETIAGAYPMFDISSRIGQKRINVWIQHLSKMPYERVMKKLEMHISDYRFPPVIADIAVEMPKENTFLIQLKQWEEQVREERERGMIKPVDEYLPKNTKDEYKYLFEGEADGIN